MLQNFGKQIQGKGRGRDNVYQKVDRVGGHVQPKRNVLHIEQLNRDQVGQRGQGGENQTSHKELVGIADKVSAGFTVKIKHAENENQTNGEIVSYKYHGITSPNKRLPRSGQSRLVVF